MFPNVIIILYFIINMGMSLTKLGKCIQHLITIIYTYQSLFHIISIMYVYSNDNFKQISQSCEFKSTQKHY